MNLFQIEIFIKVVDIGNFTKAGELLGMTQSGISHNISSLESELGIVLLNRGRNGISLTDSGERIIRNMRNILTEAESIKQETASILGIKKGKIRIGSFSSFSSKMIPTIMSSFRKEFKGIEIEFYEGSYEQITRWVEEGKVDIGFTSLNNSTVSLDYIPLIKDRFVLIIPNDHRLKEYEQIKVENIEGEDFIMPRSGCEISIQAYLKEQGVSPHVQLSAVDNQTIMAMVREGLGVTIIPELALANDSNDLTIKPLFPELSREIMLIIKPQKTMPPVVRAFINTVKKSVKSFM
ncbi:LysR family transcriptional regulator [Rummeliibacillus stabekisii]|uniref:LysR family transcriptional regulator n=1 Tax=Rummeliibacillus stabekisii TaxID=241244 RepID=UPI00117130E6|nr:LysR family transcriptional regulator [Rummeliibacillus stabekisii]MBB5171367.1 DNA-binding transcriptional LysR family regulator [Rummeliibacillus stabekisii]GEL06383.1 LysR family transcriptional regulator [Rummeliibacillus stabekisii]